MVTPAGHYEGSDGGEPGEEGGEPTFSPKEIALFAVRAIRQQLSFCLLVAGAIAFLGSNIIAALPPVYEATFKVFIQDSPSVTISIASGNDRNRQVEAARGLEEVILARDNLLSLVREAKLVDVWPRTRALPMRLKDRLVEALVGPPARRDQERAFVEMLRTAIHGEKEGESIRVQVQWRDKESAFDLANLVKRNYLAARAAHDLGPIQRAIPFLEEQLQQADQAIETAIERLPTTKPAKPQPVLAAKPAGTPDSAMIEFAALSRELSDTRKSERVMASHWRQKLTELKTQLVDAKVQYSSEHPAVQQLEARIAAASEIPDELAALREKESMLLGKLSAHAPARAAGGDPAALLAEVESAPAPTSESALAPAMARFYAAIRKSDQVSERLETARIELATAEAEFKHRYVVIEEPEVPSKPLKGKKPVLLAAVLVLAMILGMVAGTARELMRARLDEPWQVRALGVPLLAEVELKKLPSGRQS